MREGFAVVSRNNQTGTAGVLYTDSESALKLLRNMDVPKRSRHLEIRIEWLKGRVAEKALVLAFRKGVANPSDILTKCLGSSQFGVHRESLGFEVMSGPLLSLTAAGKRWVFVEVCCQPGSAISLVCKELGVMYCGITRSMEVKKDFCGIVSLPGWFESLSSLCARFQSLFEWFSFTKFFQLYDRN